MGALASKFDGLRQRGCGYDSDGFDLDSYRSGIDMSDSECGVLKHRAYLEFDANEGYVSSGAGSDGFDENYFSTEGGGDEYDEGASFDDGSRPVKGSDTRRGRCRAESVRVSPTQPRGHGQGVETPSGGIPSRG